MITWRLHTGFFRNCWIQGGCCRSFVSNLCFFLVLFPCTCCLPPFVRPKAMVSKRGEISAAVLFFFNRLVSNSQMVLIMRKDFDLLRVKSFFVCLEKTSTASHKNLSLFPSITKSFDKHKKNQFLLVNAFSFPSADWSSEGKMLFTTGPLINTSVLQQSKSSQQLNNTPASLDKQMLVNVVNCLLLSSVSHLLWSTRGRRNESG